MSSIDAISNSQIPPRVVVVQADRLLTFIFPAENYVLGPALTRSIDFVVVSFFVDLELLFYVYDQLREMLCLCNLSKLTNKMILQELVYI